jgi:hypothetical protein
VIDSTIPAAGQDAGRNRKATGSPMGPVNGLGPKRLARGWARRRVRVFVTKAGIPLLDG